MNRTKSLYCLLILAFFSLTIRAQDPFTTYENTYCGKKYVIYVSTKGNIFTLWMNAMPTIDSNETGGIIVNEEHYNEFIEALKLAKLKYEDAVKKAKEKSVTNLTKTIRIFNTVDAYFKQDKMYKQADVMLGYNFKVQEVDGKLDYLLFVNTGKLTAIMNTSVHSNGCSLVFSSAAEIDDFIGQLSTEKIDRFILNNDSTGYVRKLRNFDGSMHSTVESGLFSKLTLGLKVGVTTSLGMNNLSNQDPSMNSLNSATETTNVMNFGVFGRVDLNRFYIQPEFIISSGNKNYTLSFSDNHLQTVEFNKVANVKTVDIPLLFGYLIRNTDKTNLRVFAGPKLCLNVNSSVEHTFYHTLGTTTSNDVNTDITPSRLGLEAGFGFDFSAFSIDARYNLIQDMYHSRLYAHTIDNLSANTLVVSLGWKFFRPKK